MDGAGQGGQGGQGGLVAALLVVLLVLACWAGWRVQREKMRVDAEHFATERAREIQAAAQQHFREGKNYTEFKQRVPETDPVLFRNLRKAYGGGQLTADYVQDNLIA